MSAEAAAAPKTIRSTIPGPARPPELVAVPHAHGRRARGGVDPRRPADHDRELRDRACSSSPTRSGCSSTQVGLTSTIYLLGQVSGALIFGRLWDQLGRKRLFIITLARLPDRSLGSPVSPPSPRLVSVDCYVLRHASRRRDGHRRPVLRHQLRDRRDDPSKYRGRVDIWINGTYWAGAILGSLVSLIFLNAFAINVGWRLAFLVGPVLELVVISSAGTSPRARGGC